jgi:hypothetical protein
MDCFSGVRIMVLKENFLSVPTLFWATFGWFCYRKERSRQEEVVILLALDFPQRKTRPDLKCLVTESPLKLGENTESAEICRRDQWKSQKEIYL